jgi:hypothetical protein
MHGAKTTPTKQGKFALRANRHCEERQRRSNPFLRRRRSGLLRGACHRARIRATRWLAMTILDTRATNRPDGQISRCDKNLSSPFSKNISLSPSGKSDLPARPVLSRQEGRFAVVTNAGWDAVDAAASARMVIAGRAKLVSDNSAQDERRYSRTAKPCGPDTRCWCQAVGGEFDPTGSISHQAGSDGDKTNSSPGRARHKP